MVSVLSSDLISPFNIFYLYATITVVWRVRRGSDIQISWGGWIGLFGGQFGAAHQFVAGRVCVGQYFCQMSLLGRDGGVAVSHFFLKLWLFFLEKWENLLNTTPLVLKEVLHPSQCRNGSVLMGLLEQRAPLPSFLKERGKRPQCFGKLFCMGDAVEIRLRHWPLQERDFAAWAYVVSPPPT